jgi:hypothetical protein
LLGFTTLRRSAARYCAPVSVIEAMGYVTKIKVAGKTLHLGYFSRKSEADIVFKLRPKCERSLINTLSKETKRIREHLDPRDNGTDNGAK